MFPVGRESLARPDPLAHRDHKEKRVNKAIKASLVSLALTAFLAFLDWWDRRVHQDHPGPPARPVRPDRRGKPVDVEQRENLASRAYLEPEALPEHLVSKEQLDRWAQPGRPVLRARRVR